MQRILTIVFAVCLVMGCSDTTLTPGANHETESAAESIHGRGSDTTKWWDSLPRKEWSAYERVLEDENWFEVYRVLPDIYAIYEPHQFEEVISFLVVGDDQALLFDTGLGIARMRPVVTQLTKLDVLVVNSHSHYDHVGGNYEFDRIEGIDHAFTRKNASGRAAPEVVEFVTGDWMAKPIPPGIDVSEYEIQPFTLSAFLDEGSIIDLGGRKLQVIRTPGHSPDSLCLIDRQNRLLLTGDTFYLAPLYAHIAGADFDDYRTSVNRLAELAPFVDQLLTAHNVPIANGDYLLKLKRAFEAIDSGKMPFENAEGAHEYQFDGFSVIAPAR
ncbi:MAG: MBL fold metallo-hydrolase [Gammaproteobacteria bacterium]